jgi:hypothetical protein
MIMEGRTDYIPEHSSEETLGIGGSPLDPPDHHSFSYKMLILQLPVVTHFRDTLGYTGLG